MLPATRLRDGQACDPSTQTSHPLPLDLLSECFSQTNSTSEMKDNINMHTSQCGAMRNVHFLESVECQGVFKHQSLHCLSGHVALNGFERDPGHQETMPSWTLNCGRINGYFLQTSHELRSNACSSQVTKILQKIHGLIGVGKCENFKSCGGGGHIPDRPYMGGGGSSDNARCSQSFAVRSACRNHARQPSDDIIFVGDDASQANVRF